MPKEDWIANTPQTIFERAGLYPSGIKTILDVGCGLSLKSQYLTADFRVGLDIHRPFLERIDAKVPYVAIQADCMDLDKHFLPRSFDLVLMMDIVEHLEKPDALLLIQMAERVAKVAIVIETPKGFVPQNIDIWEGDGDHWQTHRSGWEPEEFHSLGYSVVVRDYTMSNGKRHTSIDVDPDIQMVDAIKCLEKPVTPRIILQQGPRDRRVTAA